MPKRTRLDREAIIAALEACHGIRSAAARQLGIAPATLRRRLKKDRWILREIEEKTDPSLLQTAEIAYRLKKQEPRIIELERRYARYYETVRPRRMSELEITNFLASAFWLKLGG